jgi:hypothetical protein
VKKVFIPQQLCTIKLTTDFLKEAVIFAHHNAKTVMPGRKAGTKYWTKGNVIAYLRSCGVTTKLIELIIESAKGCDDLPPIPYTWRDRNALSKCHYAAMHMLFLGHVKSNFDMISLWLASYHIQATFGKQANKYLDMIKKLRLNRYFGAHTLSTTKWGTGIWVSENYVFWSRTQKFWFLLPAILYNKHNETTQYVNELKIVHRFVVASHVSLSLLMSKQKRIENLDLIVKLYMDTMVDMDILIQKRNINIDDYTTLVDTTRNAGNRKKDPNFVKPNSLGILVAAESHHVHGPAVLHWEGGYAGEQKIQDVKPLLSIKRDNVSWEKITLRRLYQLETIDKILDKIPSENK